MIRPAVAHRALAFGGSIFTPWLLGSALAGAAWSGIAAAAGGDAAQRVWVLLVLAPLLEEAVFRAGAQECLLRRGAPAWVANVGTAVAFGLAHAALRGEWAGFAVAAPALLLGWVYSRSRRLLPCITLHALMNAVWLAMNLT